MSNTDHNEMVAFFCGGFYLPEKVDEFLKNSKVALSWANHTLQWGFIKGFQEYYTRLECYSLPQIGAYPFRYKKIRCQGNSELNEKYLYTVPFFNLSLYKHLSQYWNIRRLLDKGIKTVPSSEKVIIYIYDLNLAVLKAALKLKKRRPGIKLCLIIPDLSPYTGERNFLYRKFIGWQESQLIHLYEKVDFFVLISKYMKEKIPFIGDRYITIEGIYHPVCREEILPVEGWQRKYSVLYSGAVSVRNGIINLLEAFTGIPDDQYRLYICGVGDAVETVLQYAKRDARIIYKGQLLQREVLMLQQQSTLLVNPRTSEQAFSRYSFPSKTMEYFASGIPVLMYKLDGIPEEYYQYCYCPDDFSIAALRSKITEICSKSENELREKGQEARHFVEKMKNPSKQCGKIYHFIKEHWE